MSFTWRWLAAGALLILVWLGSKWVGAPILPSANQATPHQSQFDALIVRAARQHGVDPDLMRALIHWESGYDPRAVSSAGAMGLGQLMPATASQLGVTDPFDPEQNVDGATRLMAQLLARYDGRVDLALAGYNAGAGAVDRYGGIPPFAETQKHVQSVRALYEAYRAAGF